MVEAEAFQPHPQFQTKIHQAGMLDLQLRRARGCLSGMELELNSSRMMVLNFEKPSQLFPSRKLFQTLVPFPATPMILSASGQDHVAESQLGLGQVALGEISVHRCKRLLHQVVPGEEQT